MAKTSDVCLQGIAKRNQEELLSNHNSKVFAIVSQNCHSVRHSSSFFPLHVNNCHHARAQSLFQTPCQARQHSDSLAMCDAPLHHTCCPVPHAAPAQSTLCCLQADAHCEKAMLGHALQTWQQEAHAQAIHADKLMVAAVRWRQMSLASAFSAWVHWHQGHRQQQQTLDLVLRRWAHGHASHAFATWQHWAQEQRALRDVVRHRPPMSFAACVPSLPSLTCAHLFCPLQAS